MKKIKKAAVLVPAFATVVLATVGSVTGTMAWFTANRTATSTASVFEATTVDAALAISTAPRVGTLAVDKKPNDVKVDGFLTDASYDVGGNLYQAIYSSSYTINPTTGLPTTANLYDGIVSRGTEDGAGGAQGVKENWQAGTKAVTEGQETTNKSIWYAVSWNYTFTFTGTTTSSYALMLDNSTSVFGDSITGGLTKNGFRISLEDSTNTLKKVIGGDSTDPASVDADHEPTAVYTGGYHVGANTKVGAKKIVGKITYDAGSYLSSVEKYDTNYILVHDGTKMANYQTEAAYKASNLYFGTMNSTTTTLTYNCVAWFEGTDSHIVKDNLGAAVNSKITASLQFYLADIKA